MARTRNPRPVGATLIALVAKTLIAVVAVIIALPGTASAHTGLQSSDPADGEVVVGPINTVMMDFTGTPTAIDEGIIVADANGNSYRPSTVSQDDNRIIATFDPPLFDGSYALSWVVRSDDTHTIDGSFSFQVIAAPATTIAPTTVPSTTTAVPDQPASTTTTAVVTLLEPSPADSTSTTTTRPATTTEAEADDDQVVANPPVEPPVPPAIARADDGEATARLGRLLLYPAGATIVGMLAFASTSFAGRRRELRTLLTLVRLLAVAVAVGAALEVTGLVEIYGGLSDALERSAGWAAASRVLAGILLIFGIGMPAPSPIRSLSSAVADEVHLSGADRTRLGSWQPTGRDLIGLAGVGILLISFAFDGHTVSEGPRVAHALASIAHVVAASVWAGGVVALTVVIWRRHRDGVDSHAAEMFLRFSTIAAASVAVAGAAGLLMAWFIVDGVGYPSTDWGRRMLVKAGLVAIALAMGGYNRFRQCPALEAAPDDPRVLARARSVIAIEAVVLVLVAVATAFLVASSAL